MPRSVLCDALSAKINQLNDQVQGSALYDNEHLRLAVMGHAIPKTLQKLRPLEEIVAHIPVNYARAMFNSWLASSFIYKYGLHPSEFAFFEFVNELLGETRKSANE